MIRATYHFTDQQLDALRRLSAKTGLSVAELTRRAVDAFLQKQGMKK